MEWEIIKKNNINNDFEISDELNNDFEISDELNNEFGANEKYINNEIDEKYTNNEIDEKYINNEIDIDEIGINNEIVYISDKELETKFTNFKNKISSKKSLLLIVKSLASIISIKSVSSVYSIIPRSFWFNTGIHILKYSSNLDWRISLLCSTTTTCIFLLRNRKSIYYVIKIIR